MFLRRRRADHDFPAEIEAHIQIEEDRLRSEGLSEDEARAAARRAFGNSTLAEERFYECHRWLWWDRLRQDLRYAVRTLIHSPAFTIGAIVTLALGIGANTAIFSVIDAALLKPLPFPQPDRLVVVSGRSSEGRLGTLGAADITDLRNQASFLAQLAAYREHSFNLTGQDRPERANGAVVTANFFAALGVQAQLGRTFDPEQDHPGSARRGILSYRLWQRRYGADPGILGQAVSIDGEPVTLLGVMPPRFEFPAGSEVWLSPRFSLPEHELRPNDDPSRDRGTHFLDVVARLKAGATLAQARAEANAIIARAKTQFGDEEEFSGAAVIPLRQELVGDRQTALLILFGAVAVLLLIACANVANLFLARGATRQKEMAIRGALGAGRARLVRQLLTESMVLALAGGGLGVLLGQLGMKPLEAMIPPETLGGAPLHLDGRILAFTAVVALAAGIVFGLFPALHMARPDLNTALREGGRGSASGAGALRMRRALVVMEVALAAVLLAGAGLLIRSFDRLMAEPEGFNPRGVLTLQLSLPQSRYAKPEERANFVKRALERIAQVPGVRSASAISRLPLKAGSSTRTLEIQGRAARSGEPSLDYLAITPDYFASLGIPLERGRAFTERDDATGPRALIVTDSAAREFWPGEDPVGKLVRIGACAANEKDWCRVIGVVGDVHQHDLSAAAKPTVYVAYAQDPWPFLSVVASTRMEPASAAGAMESAIHAVDKDLPVYGIRTMEQVVAASVSPARLRMLLLGLFAALALTLASIGIYGILSYSVTERRQEIGIRIALGATPAGVRGMIVWQGARLALGGVVIGLMLSLAAARWMSSLLFGVQPADIATLTSISVLLMVVALLASFIPAWRATRWDPVEALRGE
jgi:putative ABC transport system permease protein